MTGLASHLDSVSGIGEDEPNSIAELTFHFLQGLLLWGPGAGEGGESWEVRGHLGLPRLLIPPK